MEFYDSNGIHDEGEVDLIDGCTGGHQVCADGCQTEPLETLHPPYPQFSANPDGTVERAIYNYDYSSDFDCNNGNCWDDQSPLQYGGKTGEDYWTCSE